MFGLRGSDAASQFVPRSSTWLTGLRYLRNEPWNVVGLRQSGGRRTMWRTVSRVGLNLLVGSEERRAVRSVRSQRRDSKRGVQSPVQHSHGSTILREIVAILFPKRARREGRFRCSGGAWHGADAQLLVRHGDARNASIKGSKIPRNISSF